MIKICFYLAAILISAVCSSNAQSTSVDTIKVGQGPEDLVLDVSSNSPRILISCSERRKGAKDYNEIESLSLSNNEVATLQRTNEPSGLLFHPHGIDLVKGTDGNHYLYVVNHAPVEGSRWPHNSILKYRVEQDQLIYVDSFENKKIISPNDVSALPNGSFYLTNDSGKKTMMGLVFEKLFKRRTSKIAYRSADGNWSFAAKRISYANGIQASSEKVIVAATFKKDLLVYNRKPDGSLAKHKRIKGIKGMDNVMYVDPNKVVIPSHPSFTKFLKHRKDSNNHSPVVAHTFDLNSGEVKLLYSDEGDEISACSTVLFHNDKFYMGQVFDGFILVVKATEQQ